MFIPTDELVEHAYKGDSNIGGSPRQQWEDPGGAGGYGEEWEQKSLKAKKTADLQPGGSHHEKFAGKDWLEAPPVELRHFSSGATTLSEGHHRLAWAQIHGISHVAVSHEIVPPRPPSVLDNPPPSDHWPPIKVYRLSTGGTMRTDYLIH
jgi:hypothetical protein